MGTGKITPSPIVGVIMANETGITSNLGFREMCAVTCQAIAGMLRYVVNQDICGGYMAFAAEIFAVRQLTVWCMADNARTMHFVVRGDDRGDFLMACTAQVPSNNQCCLMGVMAVIAGHIMW
jgi:hypothetical protein